jgi:hypothetical protein
VVGDFVKQSWLLLVIAGLALLEGCGGTSSSTSKGASIAGNWQFAMANPVDTSFFGGLQGGFLQQSAGSVTGSVVYAISLPAPNSGITPIPNSIPCNSGNASVSGSVNSQAVKLTASAGGQTFLLTGVLSSDGTTMLGTYDSSAGVTTGGVACGTAQYGLQWSARLVPPLSGTVNGSFHSTAGGLLNSQYFPVTGILQQGDNVGASSATVTGTLTFQGYSCLGSSHQTVTVNGGISGNTLVLQVFSDSGLQIGEIGQSSLLNPQVAPVVFDSLTSGGSIVHNAAGSNMIGYSINTSTCNANAVPYFIDQGNVCLAIGGEGTACTQPFTVSPASLTFPGQLVGATSVSQTITLTNTDPSGAALSGMSLAWRPGVGALGYSDFNGWPNFLELDSCAATPGSTFTLQPGKSCSVTIFFSPQQSCPLIPMTGALPAQCPPFSTATVGPSALSGTLTVNSPKSPDNNKAFTIPIGAYGLSAIVPTTPELNFGAEAVGQTSVPQMISFINQGQYPIQVLGQASPQKKCTSAEVTSTYPAQSGDTDGLRVVQRNGLTASTPSSHTVVSYLCDVDLISNKPNFQLSSDTCTGRLLSPGDICSVAVAYAPQPGAGGGGLDYLLQLNTQQCTGSTAQPFCEIDSGRFPVELTANSTSPLRMTPGAGLDFTPQGRGTPSDPLTITLRNDPSDPQAGTVHFQGNTVAGDFIETDDCGSSLAPGSSCTLSVVFTPTSTGFRQGTMVINYNVPSQFSLSGPQTQIVRLRGYGQ